MSAITFKTINRIGKIFYKVYSIFYVNYISCVFNIKFMDKNIKIGSNFNIIKSGGGSIEIGRRFNVRSFISINVSGLLVISDNVFINNYSSINCRNKITIGSDVLIGEGVRFYDHDHIFKGSCKLISDSEFSTAPIVVGRNVWIGSGAIILKGVEIFENSVIAAGAVVNVNVPKNSLYISKYNIKLLI